MALQLPLASTITAPNQPSVQGAPAPSMWDKFTGGLMDVAALGHAFGLLDRENSNTERALPDVSEVATGQAPVVVVPQKSGGVPGYVWLAGGLGIAVLAYAAGR